MADDKDIVGVKPPFRPGTLEIYDAFMPKVAYKDLPPSEQARWRAQARFSGFLPGMYQTITGKT